MAKSLCVTYLLWLFGGFFGLHHFYLGRYKHAFLWFCIPGGYFGAGWFRDLWRIPEYVKEANNDPEYLKRLSDQMRKHEKPPWKVCRLMGQLLAGNILSLIARISIPEEFGFDTTLLKMAISPAFCALGIWIVGNIGREEGSILYPMIGCYLGSIVVNLGYLDPVFMTIAGIIMFQWKSKKWRKRIREPLPRWKSTLFFCLFCGLYLSMISSYLYFNLKVVTKDGDEIKFRDAVGNFLKSPAVQEFRENLGKLYEHAKGLDFWTTYQLLIESLDPLGEKNALKILELPRNASQQDIKVKYRQMSKLWHPDKFKDEEEKAQAQERFVDIQQAYEILSSIKRERSRKNKKSVHNEF